ncbi:Crp/Fnr family transcriptional regulator [Lacibacter sp. H375]|uniref:Crp/Fnr family transcriptional regulator n=1 Tax=Lacibacter sp. H375 TaxID=3133424 RepID=UPI0030BC8648
MSTELFRSHLEKFIELNEAEFVGISSFFKVANFKKKENLLVEGQICKSHYFVLKGCLRKFFINEKGVEQTTEFAIENWWMTDNMAYEHKRPTEFYIQAVEHSEVLMIDSSSQEKMLAEYPKMERYFRFIYQRAFAASQMRFKYQHEFSKENSYLHFCKAHPQFVQRIPQYLVASFLGFTPEYLSELRHKFRS